MRYPVDLAWHTGRVISPLALEFKDFIRDNVPAGYFPQAGIGLPPRAEMLCVALPPRPAPVPCAPAAAFARHVRGARPASGRQRRFTAAVSGRFPQHPFTPPGSYRDGESACAASLHRLGGLTLLPSRRPETRGGTGEGGAMDKQGIIEAGQGTGAKGSASSTRRARRTAAGTARAS